MTDDKKEQENQRPRPTITTKIESQVGWGTFSCFFFLWNQPAQPTKYLDIVRITHKWKLFILVTIPKWTAYLKPGDGICKY